MTEVGAAGDPFALLGVPATHALDRRELDAALLRAGLRWHPDRHALAPAAEREAAEERMAAFNAAHAVLADPLTRAEALLRRAGVAAETGTDRLTCPAVLMKMLELKEAVAEAAGDPARLAAVGARLREARARGLAALAEACAAWEAGGADPARAGAVRARHAEASYLCRTADDLARGEAA